MSSSIRLGLAGLLLVSLVGVMPGLQATQNPPSAPESAGGTATAGRRRAQPAGGSAQPGPGRGGRGNPAAGLVTQFCASCHGPTLQGGSATSLMDEDWKFGGDDASIAASIRDGRPGTPMAALQGPHHRGTDPAARLLHSRSGRSAQGQTRDQGRSGRRGPQDRKADGQARSRRQGSRDAVGHRVPSRRPSARHRTARPAAHRRQGQRPAAGDRHADSVGQAGRRHVRRRSASRLRAQRVDLPVVLGDAARLQGP